MRSVVFAIILALAIAVSSSAAEPPNASTQTVAGTVKSVAGRPLAGVCVSLRAADGHLVHHTTTNAAGAFSISAVAPGTYKITTDKKAFETATITVTVAHEPLAQIIHKVAGENTSPPLRTCY